MVQRLITASFMVVFGGLVVYFGGTVFAVGAMLCFIVALREEYHALSVAGHRPVAWPTWVAMIICIPMAAILKRPVFSPILMVTCLLTIGLVIFRRDPHLEDGLMSLVPLFSVLLPGLCIVSLSHIQPLSVQRTLIGLLIVVPVLGDTFAYFVGNHFRRSRRPSRLRSRCHDCLAAGLPDLCTDNPAAPSRLVGLHAHRPVRRHRFPAR